MKGVIQQMNELESYGRAFSSPYFKYYPKEDGYVYLFIKGLIETDNLRWVTIPYAHYLMFSERNKEYIVCVFKSKSLNLTKNQVINRVFENNN